MNRAYDDAWRQVDNKSTCFLSDDTEVLDLGANILEEHPEIGILRLKMKDTIGP